MAAHMRRCLLATTQIHLSQVRYRRPNIQKPRPSTRERRLFEAITQPILLPELQQQQSVKDKQTHPGKDEQPGTYEKFLIRQCKKMFEDHNMVIVCQPLPMSENDKREIRNRFREAGMDLLHYSNKLMRPAVMDTRLTNLFPFLICHNLFIVGEDSQLADMVKITRRVPQLHILGGVVDNYILSKEALIRYSKLPPLDVTRGQLVTLLNMGATKTHSLLGNHQEKLSRNLEQYIKDHQEKDNNS
ncbi:39S ribosomal protein L10, mitochondrial-like [Haliotis rufescens]|uniref:39S ribosomal protein L10, mitochondrial-like n=1 Tax=Haliotis rufescens TaxID=6454 RepID=UPI00201E8A03|nr:39S ribosomal protein L10, mitochondrial-like [Haliotis rufescens]